MDDYTHCGEDPCLPPLPWFEVTIDPDGPRKFTIHTTTIPYPKRVKIRGTVRV